MVVKFLNGIETRSTIVTRFPDPRWRQGPHILWNRELIERGANPQCEDGDALGFGAAVRALYALPADQRVSCYYDRGWGDSIHDKGEWTICPVHGACTHGDLPLFKLTRAAVWLLALCGFLGRDTYAGAKARRVHDVALPAARDWLLDHADAIEAGHLAGVVWAKAEVKLDLAEREAAGKRRRRDRTARKAARAAEAVA